VPTPEEAGWLIAAAGPGLFRTYFMAAVMTGTRPEKLLALPWSNVDLDGRTVSIRVAVSWARTRAEKAAGVRGPRFFAPKTKASRRVIPLPPELVMALRWWKRQCPASTQNLVFPKPDGSPMHRKVLYDQGLVPALARAGLRHFDVYSLRHCFASTLAMQGRPATEVAYDLGHSSAAITQAIYQHWFPKERTGALDELARAVLGQRRDQMRAG
jgi:integrase